MDKPIPKEAFEKDAECYEQEGWIKVFKVDYPRSTCCKKIVHREYSYSVQVRDPFTHKPLLMWFDHESNIKTHAEAKRLRKSCWMHGLDKKSVRIVRVMKQIQVVTS